MLQVRPTSALPPGYGYVQVCRSHFRVEEVMNSAASNTGADFIDGAIPVFIMTQDRGS